MMKKGEEGERERLAGEEKGEEREDCGVVGWLRGDKQE